MLRAGAEVSHRAALPPLRNRLGVDPMTASQRPQTLLTMLYRSTDRLCRGGASVQNLTHSASFHSREKYAPSNAGTKHLVDPGLGRVIALGFNGFPSNVEDSAQRLNDKEAKLPITLHAEQNALLFAGREAKGCELYVV